MRSVAFFVTLALLVAITLANSTPNLNGTWTRFTSSQDCSGTTVTFTMASNQTYSVASSNGVVFAEDIVFAADNSFVGNAVTTLGNGKVMTSACKGLLNNQYQLEMSVLPTVWFGPYTAFYNLVSC
ncbi:hypothetical protein SAMD00019534_001790 [Acytostelium subglobosum LB1]|uniref:hypothetical protein n=1 Tax=Acytostelium subglobosum LB1 TaxID=1410327 RepID=UPI000644F930|nr:hypothetical protein SAMD00019534_001790 [Acytostelium subglobosum LB1]GAM17004.1 hypothetical protein SAMD00019534_001790 [Acytostelium subglobosum LB1]|eukprot:XP_012759066.1 hypothetical protein SAMD00019534_001790 [Acytostelium subglobosum LB1]